MNKKPGFFSIMDKSPLWLMMAAVLSIGSIVAFVMSYRLSIEFTGGVQLSIADLTGTSSVVSTIEQGLTKSGLKDVRASLQSDEKFSTLLVSLPFTDDAQVKQVSDTVSTLLIDNKHITDTSSIIGSSLNGPSVSQYMSDTALKAVVIGLLLIALYMMITFASMRKHISPVVLAVIALVTMVFDISIPMGVYAIWMHINPTITVDTIFIIAILTTMGYSINDTIVVLDRIRENSNTYTDAMASGSMLYKTVFENSLRQTMRRSLGTGASTLLAIVAMYIFGQSVMQSFSVVMGVGILAGSVSSIFIAAPLAYIMTGKYGSEK